MWSLRVGALQQAFFKGIYRASEGFMGLYRSLESVLGLEAFLGLQGFRVSGL